MRNIGLHLRSAISVRNFSGKKSKSPDVSGVIFNRENLTKHIIHGIPFNLEYIQNGYHMIHLTYEDNMFVKNLSDSRSDYLYSSKYVINFNNLDVFTCLSRVLYNVAQESQFSYFPPAAIVNRHFIQSENGTRWTINQTSSETVEGSRPSRLLETEYKTSTLYMSDYPCYNITSKFKNNFSM